MSDDQPEGRVARRQRRNREALIQAARQIMSEKGVDGATMLEIAEAADVGAGTVYNYFKSKDELAIAVLEEMMHDLAQRIEKVTDTFDDPAQVYGAGNRDARCSLGAAFEPVGGDRRRHLPPHGPLCNP